MAHHSSRRDFLKTATILGTLPIWGKSYATDVQETRDVMSPRYWEYWNGDVQYEIDERIEKYRKADASFTCHDCLMGTEIHVDQITSAFSFGAHIFNFNQLGREEWNQLYRDSYGNLFNAATVGFYWRPFEPEPGKPRFEASEKDTEAYWNQVAEPKKEPHWRRPASDPVVAFGESKGIRLHGHPILWGSRKWQIPTWMSTRPEDREAMGKAFEKRVEEMAQHYGNRLASWDVVNEHGCDYGVMPDDYIFKAYQKADQVFPKEVQLAVNECFHRGPVAGKPFYQHYTDTTLELQKRGCRQDITGVQMHLFNPKETLSVAEGRDYMTPATFEEALGYIDKTNRPIHLSEITITAPGDDERGRAIQAQVARNLYRLWFSWPSIYRITWWNTVDDCGAPGEPTTSGIFKRDMTPKPVYHALKNLIHHEWRTSLRQTVVSPTMRLHFQGFCGKYRVTWVDSQRKVRSQEFTLAPCSANKGQ